MPQQQGITTTHACCVRLHHFPTGVPYNMYYVAPTGAANTGTAGTRAQPFAYISQALSVVKPGDHIILLAGIYTNPSYRSGNIWLNEQTMRVANLAGAPGNNIVIRPEAPGAAILKGDGTAIFQLRKSSYVRIEGLVIEGETLSIPLADAKANQYIYKDMDNGGAITYRVDPTLTDEQIDAITNLPKNINDFRPSLYNTAGMLVQDSHNVEIVGCVVGYVPGSGINCVGCDYLTISNNTVHNSARRTSLGGHGIQLHTLTTIDTFAGVRVLVDSNTIRDNYNEVGAAPFAPCVLLPASSLVLGLCTQLHLGCSMRCFAVTKPALGLPDGRLG